MWYHFDYKQKDTIAGLEHSLSYPLPVGIGHQKATITTRVFIVAICTSSEYEFSVCEMLLHYISLGQNGLSVEQS